MSQFRRFSPRRFLLTVVTAIPFRREQKECLRRIEQISSSIVNTFTTFIRRSSYLLVNRSSISPLLKRLATRNGPDGETFARLSEHLFRHISKLRPSLYKSHVAELTKALADGGEVTMVTATLHALSRLSKSDPTIRLEKLVVFSFHLGIPPFSFTGLELTSYSSPVLVVSGNSLNVHSTTLEPVHRSKPNTQRRSSRWTRVVLARPTILLRYLISSHLSCLPLVHSSILEIALIVCALYLRPSSHYLHFSMLLSWRDQFLTDALDTATVSERVSHLAALSRLAHHAQDAFEAKSKEVTTFILRDVLMKDIDHVEDVRIFRAPLCRETDADTLLCDVCLS